MSARGQPFRFLAVVGLGWIGARIFLLWPQGGTLPDAIEALVPARTAGDAADAAMPAAGAPANMRAYPASREVRPAAPPPVAIAALPPPSHVAVAAAPDWQLRVEPPPPAPARFLALPPGRLDPLPDRWSASGWFVARGGRGIGAAPGGGQLGGGQAGIRVAYMLVPRARIAGFARVTAPLAGRGSEAALGIQWQPGAAPFRLLAEQRFGLDGAPGGTGLGVAGGLDTSMRGFRIQGYGQAGAILRDRIEPYADGAVRVSRAVSPRLSLGGGAWGGAQRDAQRLDIGPSATLSLGPARLSLDWRQRIAGRARPGSGLALTLGGDF